MDLLILQNADEIKIVQKKFGSSLESMKIIAWLPFAVDALRNNNIPYTTISDYVNEKYDSYRFIQQTKRYKDWCDIVDKHIAILVPEIASLGIRPFLHKLQAMRMLFFLHFNEIDKLNLLLGAIKSEKVYYFYYSGTKFCLLSRLLDVVEKNNKWGVDFIRLNPQDDYKSLYPENGLVLDWFDRGKKWKKIARFIFCKPQRRNLTSFLSGLTGRNLFLNNNPNILILSIHHDVKEVINRLKQRLSCNLIFWDDISVGSTLPVEISSDEIIDRIKNDPLSHQWTAHNGVDLFDLFVPEIERTLVHDVPMLVSTVKKFKALNNKFNFNLVISGFQLTQGEAIFDQCEDIDIPIALFQHGGSNGLWEGHASMQLCVRGKKKPSKLYHFNHSETISSLNENLKVHFKDFTAQNISMGSSYFERLIQKYDTKSCEFGDHIKICYVCAGIGIYNGGFKEGSYDDASLYELRYNVIDALKNNSNVTVYYKLGYNSERYGLELEKRIISGAWRNVKAVSSKKRLVDLLDLADVFIIEFPSTTLYEVLTTSKPVVVLHDPRGVSITKEAEEMLKDRVTIVRSDKEMIACIEDIKEKGKEARAITLPNHNDKTFITTYATCGDFNSIERTVNFLQSIVNT